MKKGQFFVITGPSGSGKTSVVEDLLARLASSARLVTTTTRQPRAGETNGADYHFLTRAEFEARRERGEFLEWAEVYGNLYGSSRVVLDGLRGAHDAVFAIVDIQGAKAIKEQVPDCVTVFLTAPIDQIKSRLARRKGGIPEDELARRVAEIEREMAFAPTFDHTVESRDGELAQSAFLIISLIHHHRK